MRTSWQLLLLARQCPEATADQSGVTNVVGPVQLIWDSSVKRQAEDGVRVTVPGTVVGCGLAVGPIVSVSLKTRGQTKVRGLVTAGLFAWSVSLVQEDGRGSARQGGV